MASVSQPLVSIITPLYNGDKYLIECIESVLAQTYRNWEYIIVNNCSTDRSLEIAERYARRDARLRVHTNAHFLAQFQNWNAALRQMAPESVYCKVLHADDWLFPECVEKMVALAEAQPSVGIVGAYRLEEERVSLDGLPFPSPVVPGRTIGRLALLGKLYVFGSPSSLLLRSDLVRRHDPFYDESILHADTDACYRLLLECDFGFVHQVLTFTRRHNESLTSLTRRLSTHALADFRFLLQYGPHYLNRDEFNLRLQEAEEHYYRFLAHRLFELKEAEFWDYQRRELERLGRPVSLARLVKAAVLELGDLRMAFQLLRQGLARRRASKRSRPPQTDAVLRSMINHSGSEPLAK